MLPYSLLSLTIGIALHNKQVSCGGGLQVTPSPAVISSSTGSVVTLTCLASHSPSICLWRTPYAAIYTVGGGRIWEEGRLTSSLLAESHQCGLTIDVLEARDGGVWQCEVGSVVDGDFTTTTAATTVTVTESPGQDSSLKLLRLLGEETILPCSIHSISSPGRRSVDIKSEKMCVWTTPYNRTYSLKDDEYEERGRLQRSGSQDCDLRVASLQLRDQGHWMCRVGTRGTHNLQAKQIQLKLQSPLKLSAPTSILQHADERATLVCHANKEYDNCQWTTPYQVTYQFDNNKLASHEQGRLQYFGFSSMDCGIVIRGLGPRDSGGWTCRVSATVAGQHSNSTDIVRLFVEPKKFEEIPTSEKFDSDYILDYRTSEYDAFDYVNGDFDRVVNQTSVSDEDLTKKSIKTEFQQVEKKDDISGDIKHIGNDKTVLTDKLNSKSTSTTTFDTKSKHNDDEEIGLFPSVFKNNDNNQKDSDITTGVNPRELEFLERISGSRIDNRPIRIDGEQQFGTKQSSIVNKKFQFGQVNIQLKDNNNEALKPVTNAHRKEHVRRIHQLIDSDKNIRVSQTEKDPLSSNKKATKTQTEDILTHNLKEKDGLVNNEETKLHQLNEKLSTKSVESSSQFRESDQSLKNTQLKSAAKERRILQTKRQKHHFQELQRRREESKQKDQLQHFTDFEKRTETREEIGKDEKETNSLKEQQELEHREHLLLEEQRRMALEDQRQRELEEKRQLELKKRRQQEIKNRRQKEIEEKRQKEITLLRQKQIEEKRQTLIEEKMQKEMEEFRLKEIEEAKLKEIEEKRLIEIEEQRKKEMEATRLKEMEENKLQEMKVGRLKEIEDRRLKENEERRLKEIQERRLKEINDARLKKIKERKLNKINEDRLKEVEVKKQIDERKLKKNTKRRKQQNGEKLKKTVEVRRLGEIEQVNQLILEENRLTELERKRENEEKQLLAQVKKNEEEKIANEKRQKEVAESIKEEKRRRLIQQRIEQRLQQEVQRKEQERLIFLLRLEEEKKQEEERKAEEIRKQELAERLEQEKKKFEERRRERIRQEEFEKKIEEERKKVRLRLKEDDKVILENQKVHRKKGRQGQKEHTKEEIYDQIKMNKTEDKMLKNEHGKPITQKLENESHKIEIMRENLKQQELQAERERKLQSEREKLKLEREKLEAQREELKRQQELLELSKKQHQEEETASQQSNPVEKECLISPWPDAGNITCPAAALSRGRYSVPHGSSCSLECQPGFVSLERRAAVCRLGSWDQVLQCVRPGAMLVVGGRSDTYGVLSSVELLTSGGVCRGALPPLPAMRWKMVAATLNQQTVLVCGGINFLGDPKTTCWRLDLDQPESGVESRQLEWEEMEGLSVPRDAAAWAAEGGSLFVMGGSLGPLSGYTASVEVWDGRVWSVGPSLTSSRASHCAMGLGNGSLVLTGGYGALQAVQRLDIASGRWTDLPSLNPLRAQHGCALVEVEGRRGMMVAGGDSGGTRLNDVRFLPLDSPSTWIRLADLNTARWGRPSIGVIGGKITVVGGWDGVKALSSVEYYEERSDSWQTSRITRLTTERRWAAATQVNTKLFPKCISKRQ